MTKGRVRGKESGARSVLVCLAVAAAVAPLASAEHIGTIHGSQKLDPRFDGQVTILLAMQVTGLCCGGIYHVNVGDGRSLYLADGFEGSQYLGDDAGTGLFSDRSPFSWKREARLATAGAWYEVVTEITYSYGATLNEVYHVTFDDCCMPENIGFAGEFFAAPGAAGIALAAAGMASGEVVSTAGFAQGELRGLPQPN